MKRSRLIGNSLRCYWRTNLAIALGMAVGTAVLAGALIVGDSIRGSMKRMTLERLGSVDYALVAQQFFGEELARDLGESSGFTEEFASATPAILLQGSIENAPGAVLGEPAVALVAGRCDDPVTVEFLVGGSPAFAVEEGERVGDAVGEVHVLAEARGATSGVDNDVIGSDGQ